MALIKPTVTDCSGDGKVMLFTYDLTTADHTGYDIEWSKWADRSVTVTSAAYGGASASIEGSNDGTTYVILADPQGGAITKNANAVETVLELTRFVRPRLTTVGSGAAVRVSILCRRN